MEEEEQQQAGLKEAQEQRLEETPLLLNGGKAVYGTDAGRQDLVVAAAVEANGEEVETEAADLEEASRAVGSALDMSAGLAQTGLTEGAKLSAN